MKQIKNIFKYLAQVIDKQKNKEISEGLIKVSRVKNIGDGVAIVSGLENTQIRELQLFKTGDEGMVLNIGKTTKNVVGNLQPNGAKFIGHGLDNALGGPVVVKRIVKGTQCCMILSPLEMNELAPILSDGIKLGTLFLVMAISSRLIYKNKNKIIIRWLNGQEKYEQIIRMFLLFFFLCLLHL